MLVVSAHMPFTDVCSTVSCWALIFSVIFPPTHVLALETAASPHPDPSPSAPASHSHRHSLRQNDRAAAAYSLTVYFDSALERISIPATCQPSKSPSPLTSLSATSSANCLLLNRAVTQISPHHSSSKHGRKIQGCKRPVAQRQHQQQQQQRQQQQKSQEQEHGLHRSNQKPLAMERQQQQQQQHQRHTISIAPRSHQDGDRTPSSPVEEEFRSLSRISDKNIKRVVIGSHPGTGNHSDDKPLGRLSRASIHRLTSERRSHWQSFRDMIWDTVDASESICAASSDADVAEGEFDDEGKNGDTSVLWQGYVRPVGRINFPKEHASLEGPIWHFSRVMPLPQPVELAWLALISCSPQSLDQLLSATKFGASAVIFYASQLQDQHQCLSLLVNNTPSSIPVFVLDTDLTTLQLALFLENIHNGSMVARVAIAATKGDLSPFSDAPCPHKDAKIREDQPIVTVATGVATNDVHRRQDTRCDTLEFLAEMVRSGATLAKNSLHRWRLCGSTKMRRTSPMRTEMERTATAEAVAIELDTSTAAVKEKGMVSTHFLPLQTLSRVDPQITTQSGHGLDKREDAINQPVKATTALQRPAGAIARKRIPALERVYIRHHHHSGRQTPAQRLVQRIYSFSVSKFVQDTAVLVRADSMAGKLAMVLMSTVCGVGVGMFGALLFVVALKVRLFQTRRRGHQHHGHHVTEHPMHGHQPMQGTRYKRVIPQVVLESFGIQTVLHTSTTAMVTTVVVKPDLAALTRVKLRYADDEIEMEEGLEDVVARENARRQRNRSRANALFPRATGLDAPDADMHVAVREADWDGITEREEMEQIGESTTLLPSQGVSETTAMDMERITAAIMNVTRRGSYRRMPQSRTMRQDGQETNDELLAPLSRTTSVSLSLSTTLSAASANGKHVRCATGEDHGDGDKDDEDIEEKEEKLPFANANAQTMCSICLVEYEVGDQLRTLPCYHQYHMVCIDPWLLTIASLCPICKRDLWPAPC